MGAFIGRAIFWLISGFIIYDIVNEYNRLFDKALNPFIVIAPLSLIFLFQEVILKRWGHTEKVASVKDQIKPQRDKIIYGILWLFVFGLLTGIVLVWLGVIYKAITRGH